MKQYIDKAIIKAEIEKFMYEANQEADIASTGECFDEKVAVAKYQLCKQIRDSIDSPEVKEVEEEPVNKDLEEAAKNHAVERFRVTRDRELAEKCKWSFKTGAKWQKHLTDSLKMKDVDLENSIICKVDWYDGFLLDYTQEQQDNLLEKIGANVGDKIRVILIKE